MNSAQAVSGSWAATTAGNWSDSTKWTGGIVATGSGGVAAINTNITSNVIVTLDSSRSIGILNIGDLTKSNNFTLATGANSLTLDNAAADGQINELSTSNGDTISGLLAIGGNGNLVVTNAASGVTLTISAGLSSALTTGTQTLTFNNANGITYSGAISNGGLGGTIALTKNGAGATTLSNSANSYTGLTTVNAGTLTISGTNATSGVTLTGGTLNANNAGALGTGTLTISGGTLNNNSAAAITNAGNNAQAWNGSFTYSGSQAFNLGSGAVTLGSNITTTVNGSGINGAGALTVGGNIGGTGKSLTKAGNGTLILSGTNSYDGGTVINAGVVLFNSAGAIGGTGNNVAVNPGGTAAFGYALDQSTLTGRVVANAKGTVALAADSSNNLDFSATGLTNLSLGASSGAWVYGGALWTPANNTYRLGGGGGTLTFNPALTGANGLLVGGSGSGGSVTLVNAGAYSGGTTVTGAIGGSTFGSVNGGAILQSNVLAGVSTTPFGGNSAITLNNGALGLGTAGALASGEVVTAANYDITYSGQNAIALKAGSGAVNMNANTLTRANHGVLLLNPSTGAALGNAEKVTVASGAPTPVNNMVSPNVVDGTSRNFVTYDGNGYKDVTYTSTVASTAGATDLVSLTDNAASTAFGGNKVVYALKLINTTGFNTNAIGEVNETMTILSGGLIFDQLGTGGFNFSADHTRASLNFGTAEAVIGVFNTPASTPTVTQSGTWMGTGGLTTYGNGIFAGNSISITGGVTVAGGTFRSLNNAAISSLNQLTVDKGGNYQFGANNISNQVLGLSGDGLVSTAGTTGNGLVIDGLNDGASVTTFSGNIQDNISLTKFGANTQVLSGTNKYTSATTINNGTLRLDFSGASAPTSNIINNVANSSALILGGGKLEIVGLAGATNTQQFNGLTLSGNSGITLTAGAGGGIPTVSLGGTFTRNTGATLNINDATGGHATTGATTTLTNGIWSVSSSNPTAFATLNGTDWATVSGGAISALSSYDTNDFSSALKNTDVTTTQTAVSGFTINSLRFNTAARTLTLGATNTLGAGGLLVTSATAGAGNGVVLTGGTIQAGTGNELVIVNNGQLQVDSVIAGAAKYLTISGDGITTLNGSNTYTAGTFLNSGTVVVGNANAFGTAGTVILNGGTLQTSSALTIGRGMTLAGNYTIGGANDVTLGGALTNATRNNILTVNNTANTTIAGAFGLNGNTVTVAGTGNVTASGVVSNGNLTYGGSGVLTLSNGGNTYAGITKITSGVISVGMLADGGANSNLGAATNVATNLVLDGGALRYTGAGSSSNRLFSVGGSGGTIDASGAGALNLTNTGAMAFNNTPGARTLTLTGSNTGNNTLTPIIADHLGYYATALTKTGAGKWVLAGANTYTGPTTVSAGTLAVNGSLGASSAVTVANGATLGGSGTIGGNTQIQSGATLSPGNSAGVLTETGNLSLLTGSNFTLELGVNDVVGRGTGYDGVNVNGLGILGIQSGVSANLVFNFAGSIVDFNDPFWDSNHSWTIFADANAPALGSAAIFDTLTLSNDSLGNSFAVTGGALTFGLFGNDILLNYSTVPEPSTYALMAIGLGAVWFLRRKKNRTVC